MVADHFGCPVPYLIFLLIFDDEYCHSGDMSISQIITRRAVPEDAATIATIHIAAWRHAYKGIIDQPFLDKLSSEYDQRVSRWQNILANNARTVFLAIAGGKPAGFASVVGSRDASCPDDAELAAIYLSPGFIGQGVGSALLKATQEEAKQQGFCSMFAVALKDNSLGRSFYERTNATPVPNSESPLTIGDRAYTTMKYAWNLCP